MRKGGTRNVTSNTSNMNTEITQAAISSFYTSQTNDNIIPAQVKMSYMGRQRGVN